jgi:hypothetical protein
MAHRLTECGDGFAIWNWTRQRIAMMIRMGPKYVPKCWTLHPDFRLCPPPPGPRTTRRIVDTGPYGLVPNTRNATPIRSRLNRLYVALDVESLHSAQTSGSSWQLLGFAVRRQQRPT